jgi:hypothetical protein
MLPKIVTSSTTIFDVQIPAGTLQASQVHHHHHHVHEGLGVFPVP